MAYCEQCGAYIPDGQEKCLACGYDPAQAASAYQAQEYAEEERRQQERERQRQEERRRRKEEYRRQAEEEYARRQAEEEYARRQAWQEEETFYDHPYSREGEVRSSIPRPAGERANNRLLSAASYLGILFLLPYLFAPEDPFARFHAKQGLLLFLFETLAGILGSFTGIGWLLNLFTLYCIYKGMTAALHGRLEALPLIGKYAGRIK